ncbi:hypothetical protein [Marinobacter sp.]|jgi:hypothetical protein|uniref:hypothetical protein n=1 Tax=Marinobacter sp. TaxID=50741 RepID=UPI002613D0C9|nr:hypothetical protein [Marinobacter sp.]
MNLSGYRETYYGFSGSASAVTRQAAFAGIALVWIFNSKADETITLPQELLWPTLFLVACLACDLLQYIYSAAIWGFYHRHLEKSGVKEDEEITAPKYFNWPGIGLFWSKHAFVLLGYYGLLSYLLVAIKFGST